VIQGSKCSYARKPYLQNAVLCERLFCEQTLRISTIPC